MNVRDLVNKWVILGALALAGILLLITAVAIGLTSARRSADVGFVPANVTVGRLGFVELRDDYRDRLARGGRAGGRFVPPREDLSPEQTTSRQNQLLARWQRVNSRLRAALERWSDASLDRIQLPHPILGKITAREMVYFTSYHGHHHIAAAKTRLPRYARSVAR